MDFVRKEIIEYHTVITKELLDSFQDGIIEAITKAEAALAIKPAVINAPTHEDFPEVGDSEIIYKAEKERLLYQWNHYESKYEPLCHAWNIGVDIEDGSTVNGGDADGHEPIAGEDIIVDGGDADGASNPLGEDTILYGGDADGHQEPIVDEDILYYGGDSDGHDPSLEDLAILNGGDSDGVNEL